MVGMVHNLADEDVNGLTLVGFSWGRGLSGGTKNQPVLAGIGEATVGFISLLWAKGYLVYQIFAGIIQTYLLAAGAKSEFHMQRPLLRLVISPNQQIAVCLDGSFRGGITWNPAPVRRESGQTIRQIHPAYVNRIVPVVVDFDPVIIIATGVLDKTVVFSHELIDYQGDFAIVLEPVISQQSKVNHIDNIVNIQVGTVGVIRAVLNVEPLLGKNMQVFQINFAVPAQITYWTVGPHRTDQRYG